MDRVLLIANAGARSVSKRTRDVIAKALSADFKLEVADTTRRDHATELARDAVDRGFDAVLAFGGDGTINEAAQAVVGTEVALGILPGGSTNVMARSLGVPADPVDATALVASRLATNSRRRINTARIGDRYFLFSAGIGLDAEVVRRVEQDPEAKRRWGEWSFVSNAIKAALTQYRAADPAITLEVPGRPSERVLLAVCCNARPLTYFGRYPVDACPQAHLDEGLDVFALRKLRTTTIVRAVWSLFVSRSHVRWRISRYHHDLSSLALSADRPLPVQVDGDYIGMRDRAPVRLVPDSLYLLI